MIALSPRKLLPLGGVVFMLLIVLAVVIGGSTPPPDASAADVRSFYEANSGREIASTFVLTASLPFLVLFAAALVITLWPSEAGVRPVWELVALGGGVVAAGAVAIGGTIHFALADGADHLSGSALQALNVLDGEIVVALSAGLGLMLLGAAGSLLSRARGHRWLGWTALAVGVLLFIPFAALFALLASGLWILAASVALFRRPGAPPYATGLAALAALAAALVVAVPASAAGNADATQVMTFDPTGAVFTCRDADYTVLGGTVRFVFHDSIAADGSEHVTQTRVPIDVTLSDRTTSTIYRLVGANSSGGNFSVVDGKYEFTDITFFNILAPTGGVVARVAGVEHVTSGRGGFSFTFGECETPQE